jgi:hypothetical protein
METVGGARVAKVLDFDGTKTIETEYKYRNNYPTGTTSSGISNRVIRYSNFVKSVTIINMQWFKRVFPIILFPAQ